MMKDYTTKSQAVTRTLASNPKAANQASISDILQRHERPVAWPAASDKENGFMHKITERTIFRQLTDGNNDNPVQLNAPALTHPANVLQRTREEVEKLLLPDQDPKTILNDTSLNKHYRCTLILINNYGLDKPDPEFIAKDITPEDITKRGDPTKDAAFNYYRNYLIQPQSPNFLTSPASSALQDAGTFKEAPRDKILSALYKHNGFVELKDGYTDDDTLPKFGLTRKDFDEAFNELRDEKIVIPNKAGLKLSKPGETGLHSSLGYETGVNKNNFEKKLLHQMFSRVMQEIEVDIFLIGGAASTILGGNKRRIKDLDFKTNSIKSPFNDMDSSKKIEEINQAVRKAFPASTIVDFEKNDQNIHAIDGEIDGVSITIGRFMNPDFFEKYDTPQNFLISKKDLLLDKAESFIFRKTDDKKTIDLFDLLWTLHSLNYNFAKLYEHFAVRKEFYESKRNNQKEKEEYAENLKDEFTSSLASFLSRGSETIHNLFLQHVENKANIKIVENILSANYPLLSGKTAQKGKPSLIIQAGNMTGDMFGVSAALIHNPLAHVLIIYENSGRDRHQAISSFYLQYVGKERVHLMESEDMSKDYSTYSGRNDKKQLPYDGKIDPEIPEMLRSPGLQFPLSEATRQVAEHYNKDSSKKIKEAWKINAAIPGYETFMTKSNIPAKGVKYAVLWSRYSGKKGGPHLQHDTSFPGMSQLVDSASDAGYVVLITGDKPATSKKDKFDILSAEGTVFNLTEFWNSEAWTSSGLDADRSRQLGFFEYLKSKGEVKHLGFRSGNLEAFALMGQTVGYMEEEGNLQKGRMEAWHGGNIRYNRIQVSLPPTLTGQYIVSKIKKGGLKKEPLPEWLLEGIEAKKNPGYKDSKNKLIVGELGENPSREFTPSDLTLISNFFSGKSLEPEGKPQKKVQNQQGKKTGKKPDTKGASTGQLPHKATADTQPTHYQYSEHQQLSIHNTTGDGSCGIHAMLGSVDESDGHPAYLHNDALQTRIELAGYMSANIGIMKPRYTTPFSETIKEIYNKVAEKKKLTPTEGLQWAHFKKRVPELEKLMKVVKTKEEPLIQDLDTNRNSLIGEIIQLIENPVDQSSIEISKFLINEFEHSTSEFDATCKLELQSAKSDDEQKAVILKSDRLKTMIQVNLDILLKKIEPGKLPASGNYHAAIQILTTAPNHTEEMVTANFDKLFGEYLEVIKNKTYFLRQEDLLSLADMKNEGLVIYREHDIERQRVIEAVSHHPERATVKRVFHQGVHYQHAELKDIQKQ